MDYTYNYHQIYLKRVKYNEFISRELSFQSHYIVFEFETLIKYTEELVIPIILLKELGITNEKIKEDFLNAFLIGTGNIQYNPEQFLKIIRGLYDATIQARELYILVCKRNNLEIKLDKLTVKNPHELSFADLIKIGQKNFDKKYKKLTLEQMSWGELFLNMMKSVWISLVELRQLGFDDEEAYDTLLPMFGWRQRFKQKNKPLMRRVLPKLIERLIETDHRLLRRLYEGRKKKYGEISSVEICTSIRPGKAILIAGHNLKDLELLLEVTKDKGIDVYSYGDMFLAHIYPKFKTYPNFAGHFVETSESYLVDFSNFPGPVLLTRHHLLNIESFFQGSLYTTDTLAPKNVNVIKDDNFEPLIQSAFSSEGFNMIVEKTPIKFSFSEESFLDKIVEVAQRIEKGKIKHLFVIGKSINSKVQKEYFDKLLNLLGDNCFVLSFNSTNKIKNIFHLESDYLYPLFYKALEILTKKTSISKLNIIALITQCELHTVSNIIYMKKIGIKKTYLTDCLPSLFNPNLVSFIRKTYETKVYTTPEYDLKDMLEK